MKQAALLVALGACGRIGFDAVGVDGDGGTDASTPFVETVGQLDPAFGTGGQTIVMRGTEDGQMFDIRPRTGGYFTFGRVADGPSQSQLLAWTRDGQLDATFSGDGVESYTLENGDWGYGLAPLASGNFLLAGDGFRAGAGADDALFAMIDEAGALVPAFAGGAGIRYVDVALDDSVYRAIETTRGIAACGVSQRGITDTHHLVIGLQLDGALDPGFGANGLVSDDSSPADDTCFDLVMDAAGRIVTIGTSNATPIVTRYTATGARDTAFAAGGRLAAATSSGQGRAIAIAPDGDLVVVGSELDGVFVARIAPDGTPRATFGLGGIVKLRLGLTDPASSAILYDVVVQPNDKIVAVGFRRIDGNQADGVVVRLSGDGELDPTFGTGGMIVLDVGPDDTLNAVHAESGGLVAVGSASVGSRDRPWIVRLR